MEKFDAFYDAQADKSRIDYYNGMDKTLQLAQDGPFGKMLKIVPMTTERVFNQINCFAVSGDQDNPVQIQSILPDLTGFVLKGNDAKNGRECQKWQKKEKIGHKLVKLAINIFCLKTGR